MDEANDSLASQLEHEMVTSFVTSFGQLSYAVLMVDSDERIVAVNQQFCDLFGISGPPSALAGSSARLVYRNMARRRDDPQAALEELRATWAGSTAVEDEHLELADGRTFVRIFVPVAVRGGGLGLWIFWETTHRMEALRDIKDARDVAAAALERKHTMLAMASHEVRGQLQGIVALVDELRSTTQDHYQRSLIASLHDSGSALHGVTDQMLNLSRIQTGALHVNSVQVDLRRVVREAAAVVRGMLSAKSSASGWRSIHSIDPQCSVWRVGDPVRLGEILTNLLVNAAKFTDEGTVSLSVKELPGHTVRFVAADAGAGIPESSLRRMNSSSPAEGLEHATGGVGLGLLITREAVGLLGGTMAVSSRPGQGTVFTVDIPLPPMPTPGNTSIIDLTSPAEAVGPLTFSGAAQWTAGDGRVAPEILVVDDSPEALGVICQMLRRLGAVVDSTQDPLDAVVRCSQRTYDLVLLDSVMPGLDGPGVARRIRDAETGRRVPIVAATADVSADVLARCHAAGMDTSLAKPFSLPELREVIERFLPGRLAPTKAQTVLPRSFTGYPSPVAAANDEDPVLGPSAMMTDLRDQPEVVIAGLRAFLERLDERVAAIRNSVGDGGTVLATAAHGLGSPAAVFGAQRLARVCGQLERVARDGTQPNSHSVLADEIGLQSQAAAAAMRVQAERLRGSLSR